MNMQTLAAGAVGVVIVIILIMVVAPGVIPDDMPIIGPDWYAKARVRFSTMPWDKVVDIIESDSTVEEGSVFSTVSLGPLFFVEIEGTMVLESLKDGVVIDRDEEPFKLGRLESSKSVNLRVRLGDTGSGTYTVRAVRYKNGEPRWDQTDEWEVTI